MRSTLSGGCTPPRLTKPLTSPRGRRTVLPLLKINESALLSFSLCTPNALPPSSPIPTPSVDLLQRFSFAQTLLSVHGTPEVAGRTLALFTGTRGRDQSARAELGCRRFLLAPPSPVFPASGRASASVSLFLIFSPFSPSFSFLFSPFPPLPPFPLGGASPGQGQSRPHPAPLPGPRRPMARGRPLLTRAPAVAVGGAGPAAAASGPGSSWN